jgi:hypothetical protein
MSLLEDEYLIGWILFFPLISLFGFLITIVEHPLLVILVTLFLIGGIYGIYNFVYNIKINYKNDSDDESDFYYIDNEF